MGEANTVVVWVVKVQADAESAAPVGSTFLAASLVSIADALVVLVTGTVTVAVKVAGELAVGVAVEATPTQETD